MSLSSWIRWGLFLPLPAALTLGWLVVAKNVMPLPSFFQEVGVFRLLGFGLIILESALATALYCAGATLLAPKRNSQIRSLIAFSGLLLVIFAWPLTSPLLPPDHDALWQAYFCGAGAGTALTGWLLVRQFPNNTPEPSREIKVKAHAFTLASVVMLFFLPFAVFGLLLGAKEGSVGGVIFGSMDLLLHAYLIGCAIHYFRTEKPKPT